MYSTYSLILLFQCLFFLNTNTNNYKRMVFNVFGWEWMKVMHLEKTIIVNGWLYTIGIHEIWWVCVNSCNWATDYLFILVRLKLTFFLTMYPQTASGCIWWRLILKAAYLMRYYYKEIEYVWFMMIYRIVKSVIWSAFLPKFFQKLIKKIC